MNGTLRKIYPLPHDGNTQTFDKEGCRGTKRPANLRRVGVQMRAAVFVTEALRNSGQPGHEADGPLHKQRRKGHEGVPAMLSPVQPSAAT